MHPVRSWGDEENEDEEEKEEDKKRRIKQSVKDHFRIRSCLKASQCKRKKSLARCNSTSWPARYLLHGARAVLDYSHRRGSSWLHPRDTASKVEKWAEQKHIPRGFFFFNDECLFRWHVSLFNQKQKKELDIIMSACTRANAHTCAHKPERHERQIQWDRERETETEST